MALRSSAEAAQPEAGRTVIIDPALPRKSVAELLGTAMLVFFGAAWPRSPSASTRSAAASRRAISSSLTFGIVLLALVAIIGPISGCHINPAVSLGALLARRITLIDVLGYWVAQFIGGILGALLLLWVLHASPFYIKSRIGLAANGWGCSLRRAARLRRRGVPDRSHHHRRIRPRGPERDEERGHVAISGVVMGLALTLVNLVATPVDGASVNPARSFGPALVSAGQPLRQLWLFLLAPLVGAVLAAGVYLLFHPRRESEAGGERGQQGLGSPTLACGCRGGNGPAGAARPTASGTGCRRRHAPRRAAPRPAARRARSRRAREQRRPARPRRPADGATPGNRAPRPPEAPAIRPPAAVAGDRCSGTGDGQGPAPGPNPRAGRGRPAGIHRNRPAVQEMRRSRDDRPRDPGRVLADAGR